MKYLYLIFEFYSSLFGVFENFQNIDMTFSIQSLANQGKLSSLCQHCFEQTLFESASVQSFGIYSISFLKVGKRFPSNEVILCYCMLAPQAGKSTQEKSDQYRYLVVTLH